MQVLDRTKKNKQKPVSDTHSSFRLECVMEGINSSDNHNIGNFADLNMFKLTFFKQNI